MKIVALSGSHGVGKTSLINKLYKDMALEPNLNIQVFSEINSGLYNIGFSLNGKAKDFDEVIFSQKCAFDLGYNLVKYYLTRAKDDRIVFLDRSYIDTFIYTKYFFIQNNSPNEYLSTINYMYEKCLEFSSDIQHWLLPPFSDFDAKKERMDLEARDEIWNMITNYFKEHSNNFTVLKSNNTNERYKEIFTALQNNIVPKDTNCQLQLITN